MDVLQVKDVVSLMVVGCCCSFAKPAAMMYDDARKREAKRTPENGNHRQIFLAVANYYENQDNWDCLQKKEKQR